MKNDDPALLIGAEAALALALRYFDPPHRAGDARVFAAGRLHLWSGWRGAADADLRRIATFLRLRPRGLEEDPAFLHWAKQALDKGARLKWVGGDEAEKDSERAYALAPGKPLDQLIDELLAELEQRQRRPAPRIHDLSAPTELRARRVRLSLPVLPVAPPSWPKLETTPARSLVTLERGALLEGAKALDGVGGVPYSQILGRMLSDSVRVSAGNAKVGDRLEFPAGPTQLLMGPTGAGKTVLARSAAVEAASRGIPVAYVVPDRRAVLEETQRIEACARARGLKLNVVPLNAARSVFDAVTDALQHEMDAHGNVDHESREAPWAFRRLGYYCKLTAYAPADAAEQLIGNEPCSDLKQVEGERERPVVCPFAAECPKLGIYRSAPTADVLVVNHSAFLVGRMPIPVIVEGRTVQKLSFMELILRRCPLVLIDEVDHLQALAIDQGTGGLQLTSDHARSPLHQLLVDFEERSASGQIPDHLRFDADTRRPLFIVRLLVEELNKALASGLIEWTWRDRMRWSRSQDSTLARRLFGESKDRGARLDSLFRARTIPDQPSANELRRAVRAYKNSQPDRPEASAAQKADLVRLLDRWELHGIRDRDSRRAISRLADGLMLRGILSRLEQGLNHLRPHLVSLDEHGLPGVDEVREALLGYMPFVPSPLGPLRRRVMGFTFDRKDAERGVLRVQALAGDPHGLVAGLGDEVALALAGARRAVVGISATARFAGAPKSDVLAPIMLAQPDSSSTIRIEGLPVVDPARDGRSVRVSGVVNREERLKEVARLANLLWKGVLPEHLRQLAADAHTQARARVLLVTGSYHEAQAVGRALAAAIGDPSAAARRIRYLCRDPNQAGDPYALASVKVESFAATGADVLVAPLAVVCRGHNILAGGSTQSAIASIFVLVRPVPPCDDVDRVLALVSYDARLRARSSSTPGIELEKERRRAEQRLRFIQQHSEPFSQLPRDLRHHVLCDTLVDLAQLAGRARRGGTDVRLFLVDAAFHDGEVGWPHLIKQAFAVWERDGVLEEMKLLHGPLLSALETFATSGRKEGADAGPDPHDVLHGALDEPRSGLRLS